MYGWQIWVLFFVPMLLINVFLSISIWEPSQVHVDIQTLFVPSNEVFATFLTTTSLLVLITISTAFLAVYYAANNNSFSKNPEDLNTGNTNIAAKTREDDDKQDRVHRIHTNLLENVPLMIVMQFILVLVGTKESAAQFYMWGFFITRCLHFFWYFFAGSHEIRATFYSFGVFCTFGCIAQALSYAGLFNHLKSIF